METEAASHRKRKLIEVALPLEAINRESAREKSIRHRHPSTLHLWWARRPLAAARAVLFAQLVDDPSARPDLFPTHEAQADERKRLFRLIERMVVWGNTHDDQLMEEAWREIVRSCGETPPTVVDPFAGGGSIPVEAQRLGLSVESSDLNPVAIAINRALLDVPRRWLGRDPIFPNPPASRLTGGPGASGLAADIRWYGDFIVREMQQRLSATYPDPLGGKSPSKVVAWLWARTVECTNPACKIRLPLVRSWWLRKKRGQEALVVPRIDDTHVTFTVETKVRAQGAPVIDGTVGRSGAVCIKCGGAIPLAYIRSEGKAGRIGSQMLAVVIEGARRREYLAPSIEDEAAAKVALPSGLPDTDLPAQALGFRVQAYGMLRHIDLFTRRQLLALQTLMDVVREVQKRIEADAVAAGMTLGDSLREGGKGAKSYAEALTLYFALALDRVAMSGNSLCRWNSVGEKVQHVFGRQAISMLWDFAEANPLGRATGSVRAAFEMVANAVEGTPVFGGDAVVRQADAATRDFSNLLVSTDPPYYDNVGYADLSDFFYVWLRPLLGEVYPELFQTLLTPKAEELVAEPFRHNGYENAERFFESGFERVFAHARQGASFEAPITVFYAFKQAERDDTGVASTGWETLLAAMLRAGWSVTATWPIRTEMATRMRGMGSNALASSIVLACRPRPEAAGSITRRAFIQALQAELPRALRELQQGSLAPVDLAQAAIGPGMAVFSRFVKVVEPDGSDMSVRTALGLINHVLDEVLSEQEGDFDADTRFCIKWFAQYGWDEGDAGTADTLSRAINTSVAGLERGGVFRARAGRARLIEPAELSGHWDPATDERISVWEVVVRLAKALNEKGADDAGRLMAQAGRRIDLDTAKELAYLLFSICERRGWTQTALLFNGLGTSWSDLAAAARTGGSLTPPPAQGEFDFSNDEE
ncbi:hypothetical protein DLJ47_19120 [Micromonospora sp. S4605]|uniref:DUF1156 domain-containing protein n=1 Tax=Micromonospora sp. S4605 TaxID=1420897 RepID=UPI000D6FFFD0|nr:DUF1156 domain-containing protein [Micromonospora sp. S4605]PWU52348.1 hypothetical protein DLJ47_19120 [Micromonospora sp. S4605]